MRNIVILGESRAKGDAFLQAAGISAATGRNTFAGTAGFLVIGVEQGYHKRVVRRHMVGRFIGCNGCLNLTAKRRGSGGSDSIAIGQQRITEIQHSIQSGIIISDDAKIAGQRAAGLIRAANFQAGAIVFQADRIRQHFQRAADTKRSQHQQQHANRIACHIRIRGVTVDAGCREQNPALGRFGFHIQRHLTRKRVDMVAFVGFTLNQSRCASRNHIVPLANMVSEGMLCAATELKVPAELYPNVGDEGLLLFQEEYPVGSDVKPILGLDDTAVDFEILANRPDCLCALGVARETAAALGTAFKAPTLTVKESAGDIHQEVSIRVDDPDRCPRYAARVIKNVRIGPSPMWLRKYLFGAGLRSINNIVDITNYVMIEYGHPMHAFDLSKVRGRKIIVRCAQEGETLTTLDGEQRQLRATDLVICDEDRATGLAGIMGGEESEITDNTTEVMFECASFDRTAIRLTSRALGMRTESSGRFERGVSPATVMDALDRACMLVNLLNAGDVVGGVFDSYPHPLAPQVVTASVKRIAERAGVPIPAEAMVRILTKLFYRVECEGDRLTATVPAFRSDVDGEADLCEDVLRIYGFEHIGCTRLRGETTQGGITPMLKMKNRIAQILQGMGSIEVMQRSAKSETRLPELTRELQYTKDALACLAEKDS